MTEEVIRAKRIELVDDEGNLKLVMDGGEARGDDYPGLTVYGPDGPNSVAAIHVDPERGVPAIWLTTAGGGAIMVTFSDGIGLVHIRNEDGTEGTLVVEQEGESPDN